MAEVFVDHTHGKDTNPGTLAAPVKTAAHGLTLLRKTKGGGGGGAAGKALVLREGVHPLDGPLELSAAQDSGLTIRSHPADAGPHSPRLQPLKHLCDLHLFAPLFKRGVLVEWPGGH